jgi:hypothetical protein
LAAQRNRLILGYLTRSSLGSGREAGYRGQAQAIDFQCCIFTPLKGCCKVTHMKAIIDAGVTHTPAPAMVSQKFLANYLSGWSAGSGL